MSLEILYLPHCYRDARHPERVCRPWTVRTGPPGRQRGFRRQQASLPGHRVPPPAEADEAAGAPSEFEFLIKKTDNNGWITDAGEGLEVEVSQVLGGGFPIKEEIEGIKYDFPTQNVLLFANGSGIAPLRSAIESGQLGTLDGGRSARLYYGVATPSDMPYAERFPAWEKMGIEVVPVISRPEEVDGGWLGRVGYVQTALEEDGVAIPRNTGALMCGVKGMCEGVKDILTRAGTFEGRVLTNF